MDADARFDMDSVIEFKRDIYRLALAERVRYFPNVRRSDKKG